MKVFTKIFGKNFFLIEFIDYLCTVTNHINPTDMKNAILFLFLMAFAMTSFTSCNDRDHEDDPVPSEAKVMLIDNLIGKTFFVQDSAHANDSIVILSKTNANFELLSFSGNASYKEEGSDKNKAVFDANGTKYTITKNDRTYELEFGVNKFKIDTIKFVYEPAPKPINLIDSLVGHTLYFQPTDTSNYTLEDTEWANGSITINADRSASFKMHIDSTAETITFEKSDTASVTFGNGYTINKQNGKYTLDAPNRSNIKLGETQYSFKDKLFQETEKKIYSFDTAGTIYYVKFNLSGKNISINTDSTFSANNQNINFESHSYDTNIYKFVTARTFFSSEGSKYLGIPDNKSTNFELIYQLNTDKSSLFINAKELKLVI